MLLVGDEYCISSLAGSFEAMLSEDVRKCTTLNESCCIDIGTGITRSIELVLRVLLSSIIRV